MAENSKIEWLGGGHTVNLWWGCSKVNTGCKNCYAEKLSRRFDVDEYWGDNRPRKRIKSAFKDLNKYQKQAEKANKKVRVFIGSMMDIFEERKQLINPLGHKYELFDTTGKLRTRLFAKIILGEYENLIFLFLTKRPENIIKLIPQDWINNTPKNVWFGTSVSNQETVINSDILRGITNIKRFLSIEPQIEIINNINLDSIDWVIQGGESGHNKRPFNIKWAYVMKELCKRQNTPYFFKQIDKVQPIPNDLNIKEVPNF